MKIILLRKKNWTFNEQISMDLVVSVKGLNVGNWNLGREKEKENEAEIYSK